MLHRVDEKALHALFHGEDHLERERESERERERELTQTVIWCLAASHSRGWTACLENDALVTSPRSPNLSAGRQKYFGINPLGE